MVELEIVFDRRKYNEVMLQIEKLGKKEEISNAIIRAAKKAGNAAKDETARLLGEQYTLPVSELGTKIQVHRVSTLGRMGATMDIVGNVTPLAEFKGVHGNNPVQAKVKKSGGGVLSNAFWRRMKSGHLGVFEPEEKARLSMVKNRANPHSHIHINEIWGPAASGMFRANPEINEPVLKAAEKVFEERVVYEFERLING